MPITIVARPESEKNTQRQGTYVSACLGPVQNQDLEDSDRELLPRNKISGKQNVKTFGTAEIRLTATEFKRKHIPPTWAIPSLLPNGWS